MKTYTCRFCKSKLKHIFADLGKSPIANDYPKNGDEAERQIYYPLRVYICHKCKLVQIPNLINRKNIFNKNYAYFSSYSKSWLGQAEQYTQMIIKKLKLDLKSTVVELASNDGYLLQFFKHRNIPVYGIEPSVNVAQAAKKKGLKTIVKFFGVNTAIELKRKGLKADLIIGNNVLAHVPDINDFVKGIDILLKDNGTATLEFHHLMRMVDKNEFDMIYHEHYSYFSLIVVKKIFAAHNLIITDVEELTTQGGSLRIYVKQRKSKNLKVSSAVNELTRREIRKGYNSPEFYSKFQDKILETKKRLVEFLLNAKKQGKHIAAYGAPAKGNTLLNFCGIDKRLIDFTVDRNPFKQNHLLPGSKIPIFDTDKLKKENPDYILILPWNLKKEIITQVSPDINPRTKFIIPIPKITVSN